MSRHRGRPATRRATLAAGVLAAAVLAMVFLAGCGSGDPYESYCDEVVDQQQPLTAAFAQGETTGLFAALPSFEALREDSPDDVADDWAIVVARIAALRDALDAAGVDPTTYEPDEPPTGLSDDDANAIQVAAVALASPASTTAFATVQQQVRDVCQTPLSLG